MNKELAYKKQRQIRNKINELEDKQKIGPFKLETPYQSGWWGTYELRQDILNRKDSDFFKWVLEYINSKKHCNREDFKTNHFLNKNKIISIKPELKSIRQNIFEKMTKHSQWGKKVERYFIENKIHNSWVGSYNIFKFTFPWIYEWKTTPCWIVEYYDLKGNVVSEIQELETEFRKLGDWNNYLKYLYGKIEDDDHRKESKYVKYARSAGIEKITLSNGNSSLRKKIKNKTRNILIQYNNETHTK
jgi:hypothetical protein